MARKRGKRKGGEAIKPVPEAEREQVRILRKLEREDYLTVDEHGRQRVRADMQKAVANLTERHGVIRVREEDPLNSMLSKSTITSEMYAAGLEYRKDHENSQKGGVGGAAWTERVDGGTPNYDAPAQVLDSVKKVKALKARVGDISYHVLEQIVGEQKSIRTLETETEWPRVWISFTLKWALEEAAVSYGILSPRRRTIVRP